MTRTHFLLITVSNPVGDQLLAGAHEYLLCCKAQASVVRQPPGVSSRSELKIAQEGSVGERGRGSLWGLAFKYTLSMKACSMYRNPSSHYGYTIALCSSCINNSNDNIMYIIFMQWNMKRILKHRKSPWNLHRGPISGLFWAPPAILDSTGAWFIIGKVNISSELLAIHI